MISISYKCSKCECTKGTIGTTSPSAGCSPFIRCELCGHSELLDNKQLNDEHLELNISTPSGNLRVRQSHKTGLAPGVWIGYGGDEVALVYYNGGNSRFRIEVYEHGCQNAPIYDHDFSECTCCDSGE